MKKYILPQYPLESDMWDFLANEKRPIVVYGMGNGADKLFARFEKYGISVADVFASDGFVRGHSFRGYRVKSFSEIKENYSDFVIVLSFASNREEVINMLTDIDEKYDMLVPDMPIADESEYFDKNFYNEHYEEIVKAYNMLCDEESKKIYALTVNYKLTGKLSYLMDTYTEKRDMYSLISKKDIRVMIDGGAYNGDTAREAIEYFSGISEIYAIEPDVKTFKRLKKYADTAAVKINPINAALYSENGQGEFFSSGNRNSTAKATASYESKAADISFITVDSLEVSPDYIKYDVEGAEYEALIGSLETINRARPVLLVSLYHRSRDIFSLPLFLAEKTEGYRFYLCRLRSVPAWELNLILIPT